MTKPLTTSDVATAMEGIGRVDAPRWNRIRVSVPLGRVRDAIERAANPLACDHLVQISTVDNGKTFELGYHLTGSHRTIVSIAAQLPREEPRAPSVADLLPPAGLYERQIHDLFGIVFEGHPDLKRVILNEDWPTDEFPLRKDWKPKAGVFYGGVKEGT